MRNNRADYDVVIVGASLAGASAAIRFAQHGLRVALIERSPEPSAYKKLCTHFIQPSAASVIERLEVADDLAAAGAVRGNVHIWTRWGWIRPTESAEDPLVPAWSVRREVLDPLIRRRAAAMAGVDLVLGETARGLIEEGGRVVGVRTETRERESRETRARLTVAADGRNSRIAELSGLPSTVRPNARFSYFAYYRDLPFETGSTAQMWFLEPDIAYRFPNDDGVTVLACMITRDKLDAFKADLSSSFRRAFGSVPDGPDLSAGRQVSPIMGMIDIPNVVRPPTRPGLALVGDAALATDPLWGVGCGWAMQSAELLAESTAGPLSAGNAQDVDRGLRRYRKLHKSAFSGHHDLICDFSTGRGYNLIERLFFAAATRDPKSARHFEAFGSRWISPRQFLAPAAIAHAARVNLRNRNGSTPLPPPAARPDGVDAAAGSADAGRRDWVAPAVVGGDPAEDAAAVPVTHDVTIAGVRSRVRENGPRDATEAVVFVHGNPGSSEDWTELAREAGAFCRTVTCDMPGFGRADKPSDFDYSVAGYARHLASLLDVLGIRRAHLVLHDFGGPWGLAWAASHPEAVASITLINTGVLFAYRWHYLAKIWRTPMLGELFQATATRPTFRMLLRHGNPRGLPRAFVDRMYDDYDGATRRAVLALYRATSDPAGAAMRLATALRPIRVPTLVVWGRRDPYLPFSLAFRQREVFPGAQVVILDESGHWPFVDNPGAVAGAVIPFLRHATADVPTNP